ncbi:hypothetical protein M407DRAFT_18442 [Tulasnella calospora MUT 4182]|uniref:F-box domain-containing protein n=1 Tax=Tulasnella calospora MUT 4182 TaxID=1051891 RepID=A0A0C3QVJ3_9AGAM|nr:hypothetical protein M407DRAFT_18442 [Tulasnella calospora MUT 4182]
MPFDLLPPELILQILQSLPVQDITAFNLASRYCHNIVLLHENAVYQAVAAFHGFIQPSSDRHSPPLISENFVAASFYVNTPGEADSATTTSRSRNPM